MNFVDLLQELMSLVKTAMMCGTVVYGLSTLRELSNSHVMFKSDSFTFWLAKDDEQLQ